MSASQWVGYWYCSFRVLKRWMRADRTQKEQCSSSLNGNNASIPAESPSLSSMGREPDGFGPITEPEARGGTSCEVRKPCALYNE